MMLEGAIKHYRNTADSKDKWANTLKDLGFNGKSYAAQAIECKQLVEWLTELKQLREKIKNMEVINEAT